MQMGTLPSEDSTSKDPRDSIRGHGGTGLKTEGRKATHHAAIQHRRAHADQHAVLDDSRVHRRAMACAQGGRASTFFYYSFRRIGCVTREEGTRRTWQQPRSALPAREETWAL